MGSTESFDAPSIRPRSRALVGTGLGLAIALVAIFTMIKVVDARGANIVPGKPDPRGFAFARVDGSSGTPLRYAACRPIHYVINPRLAPDGGVADARRAIELTAEATGMRFVYDGTTKEEPSEERKLYQPDRYGDRWAPLLLTWANGLTDPAGSSDLKTIGVAGSAYALNRKGDVVYVTGTAVFDATADINSGFGGKTWGQVMLHELGHVVGLDHIDDPTSVMNPELGLRAAAWGTGDRAGLWELGIGSPCLEQPRP